MRFDQPGYELKFVQQRFCTDGSAHLFTRIYKFYSPVTKLVYILHADYHDENFFGVKFYAKQHRQSEYKYSKVINRGDVANILITCLKVVPLLLSLYPGASFGFIGSRTIDSKSNTVEALSDNQRFRIYKYLVERKIGFDTFEHFSYQEISGYLLINKAIVDILNKESAILKMLAQTYQNLLQI